MIELNGLIVYRGGRTVLRGINTVFSEGEIVGILGPSGSGKSILLDFMGGLPFRYEGKALLDGLPLDSYTDRELSRIIGRPLKGDDINGDEILADFLLLGRLPWRRYGRPFSDMDREITRQVADSLGLSSLMNRPLHALSGGMMKLALTAFAIILQPRILLLDNPSDGLDPASQASMLRVLTRNVMDGRKTVVMAGGDINFISACADRIIVLQNGSIAYNGSPADISGEMMERFFGSDVVFSRNLYSGRPLIHLLGT